MRICNAILSAPSAKRPWHFILYTWLCRLVRDDYEVIEDFYRRAFCFTHMGMSTCQRRLQSNKRLLERRFNLS